MKLSKLCTGLCLSASLFATPAFAQEGYQPAPENVQARQNFADHKFGIFLHWGIYSMFAQGEWYLQNANIDNKEYAKAAKGFYPAQFDAKQWVSAFKQAGAKYICFTTRHHDGFSMFDTKYSDYDIVDASPFKRDIVRELADECKRQGIKFHLYYSHIDWTRDDYPTGRTGRHTGKDPKKEDWNSYFTFMNIQIFERDLPGENSAGLSGQSISRLPLETCQTMNGMWGYKVVDQNYKSVKTLIQYLVGAAGKGANLLLNIGPQPDGELPAAALDRLKGMGEWLEKYGETVYGTTAGDVPTRPWGVTTRKGDKQYVHIMSLEDTSLFLPITAKVKKAVVFDSRKPVQFKQTKDGILLDLGLKPQDADYIVELTMAR